MRVRDLACGVSLFFAAFHAALLRGSSLLCAARTRGGTPSGLKLCDALFKFEILPLEPSKAIHKAFDCREDRRQIKAAVCALLRLSPIGLHLRHKRTQFRRVALHQFVKFVFLFKSAVHHTSTGILNFGNAMAASFACSSIK